MKYVWKKDEKEFYLPKNTPAIVEIPEANYICIRGNGNPNGQDFTNRVGVLYKVSYAIKMMPKNGFRIEGYFDYSVYPLEGLWDLTDEGKNSDTLIKDELLYTIMIKQPSFVDKEVFNKALEIVKHKHPNDLLSEVYFDKIEDGLSVQMLHNGSYDDEPKSFSLMKQFIEDNNLKIKNLIHREIYISDARKVAKEKLRTVLRYRVTK